MNDNIKCPYAVNRQIITQTVIEYDEDGNQGGVREVMNNKAYFIDCLKDKCGAYKDCECHYKG